MFTRLRTGVILPVLLLLAAPHAGRGEDSPLKLVPAKTPLMVQLRGVEAARGRLAKMIEGALPAEGKMAGFILEQGITSALKGRSTKSISKDGHIILMVNDLATITELPELAALVPVSSYAEFRGSFLTEEERKTIKKGDGFETVVIDGKDEPICMIDLKSHVLIASDRDVAKSLLKKADTLEGKISADARKAFLDTDLALYINLQSINDAYGATLKQYKGLIELLINMGGQAIDKKQIDMIKGFFDGVLQLLDDGQAAVVAVDFRPEGLAIKLQAQFQPKTDTANFLQSLKVTTLEEMANLPAGQMSYSASRLDPRVIKALSSLMSHISADDEDEAAKQAIEKALEDFLDAGLEGSFSTSTIPAASLEVSTFKDPQKAVASTLKLLKSLTKTGSFENVPLKGKPEIKEADQEFAGFKLNSAKLAFDMEKALAELPEGVKEATRASMTRMLGGEKVNMWFGTDGKRFVKLVAPDWKTAQELLKKYTEGSAPVAKDGGFQVTRKNLPAEATLVTLFDGAQLVFNIVDLVKEIAQAVPGFPGGIPELKPVGGKPAYLGFALTLKAEHASVDIFVPVTAVQQIRKLLEPALSKDN